MPSGIGCTDTNPAVRFIPHYQSVALDLEKVALLEWHESDCPACRCLVADCSTTQRKGLQSLHCELSGDLCDLEAGKRDKQGFLGSVGLQFKRSALAA